MNRVIRPGAGVANKRGAAAGPRNADGALLLKAVSRHVMRAGGEQQVSVRSRHGRGEARKLAIGARAAFKILARFDEGWRVGDYDIEAVAPLGKPRKLLEHIRFYDPAHRRHAVRFGRILRQRQSRYG